MRKNVIALKITVIMSGIEICAILICAFRLRGDYPRSDSLQSGKTTALRLAGNKWNSLYAGLCITSFGIMARERAGRKMCRRPAIIDRCLH
jgi:hypothetical protein